MKKITNLSLVWKWFRAQSLSHDPTTSGQEGRDFPVVPTKDYANLFLGCSQTLEFLTKYDIRIWDENWKTSYGVHTSSRATSAYRARSTHELACTKSLTQAIWKNFHTTGKWGYFQNPRDGGPPIAPMESPDPSPEVRSSQIMWTTQCPKIFQ